MSFSEPHFLCRRAGVPRTEQASRANSKRGTIHTSGHLRAMTKNLLLSSLLSLIETQLGRVRVAALSYLCPLAVDFDERDWLAKSAEEETTPSSAPAILRRHVCTARTCVPILVSCQSGSVKDTTIQHRATNDGRAKGKEEF